MKRRDVLLAAVTMLAVLGAAVCIASARKTQAEQGLWELRQALESGKLDGLQMRIYSADPYVIRRFPLTRDNIAQYAEHKITIQSEELREHTALLERLCEAELKPVKRPSGENLSIYYYFEMGEQTILDVALWSAAGEAIVNGDEVQYDNRLLQAVEPFLPEAWKKPFDQSA